MKIEKNFSYLNVSEVVLSNSTLNSTEKLILSLLISSIGKSNYKQSEIAERFGMSVRQVNRSIQSLISKNLITLSAENGVNKTRNYHLQVEKINELFGVELIKKTK